MDVYLNTLGCRLNEAELETWTREFRQAGHRVLDRPDQANVIVFNTCAVTAEAARKSRQRVRRLHRTNPLAKLVVTGCYAELEPEKVAGLMGVDLVLDNMSKPQLVTLIEEKIEPVTMPVFATEPDTSHMFRKTRNRAFVKIQDGCKNRCTFCVVTIARGDERSRSIDEIVDEVQYLGDQGYQEVVLTGVHLGGYGRDLGTELYVLVERVLAETDIPRVRLGSLEPWDLPDNMWSLWSNKRLCPHLHLPLQSGSDAVLKRMARRCNKERYQALVDAARAHIPGLSVTTDLIVGFPGESDEEWAESLEYVQKIGFAHMHIFTYSPRQGTKAARMKGHLTKEIKRQRSRVLHEVADQMKRAHFQRFVDTHQRVLWEGKGELLSEGGRRWSGYTENYLRVSTQLPEHVILENLITDVRITAISEQGLLGVIPDTQGLPAAAP